MRIIACVINNIGNIFAHRIRIVWLAQMVTRLVLTLEVTSSNPASTCVMRLFSSLFLILGAHAL